MRKNKFDESESDLSELLIDKSPTVEHEYSNNKIMTYGTLNQKRCKSVRKPLSIPVEVIDFIDTSKAEGEDTHETLIFAHMLLLATRHIEKELIEGDGDYEIKSTNL
jgi:hypothetical protein